MNENLKNLGLLIDPRLMLDDKGIPNSPPALHNLRVSQRCYSRDIAARFSVGGPWGAGSGGGKQRDFAIRYEALFESNAEPLDPMGDTGEIFEKVYAIGVTIDISVTTAESEVHFDIFSVSAAVQLQMAEASYRTSVYCTDSEVLRKLLPDDGSLNNENCDKIIAGISAAKIAIGSNSNLQPQVYYRPRKIAASCESELGIAQCVAFAMRYLSIGKKVNTAIEDAVKVGLDGTLVRLVYGYCWPDVKDDVLPPTDVKSMAARWLFDSDYYPMPHTK